MKQLTDEQLDRIIETEAGIWPDFWSRDTIKRVIAAGMRVLSESPEHGMYATPGPHTKILLSDADFTEQE